MSEENVQLVRRLLEAFNERDVERFADLTTPDFEWSPSMSPIEQKTFLKAVNKNYAYKKVLAEVKKRGYTVVEEKTDQQQTVQIRVRKFS